MAEYIKREALINSLLSHAFTDDVYGMGLARGLEIAVAQAKRMPYREIPDGDVVPASELKEFAEDVIYQFGYKCIGKDGRLHLTAGGLSTLETAFAMLGWPDPKPYPEGECEWEGCHEYASCGTPTPDGYKRLCGTHYRVVQAREEAERIGKDGDNNG